MALNHHRTGWTALRSGEQALLNSYHKNDVASKRKTPKPRPELDKQVKTCWTRRSQLDTVKSRLRQGYTIKESNKLHRQRDNYEDYLRQFCTR